MTKPTHRLQAKPRLRAQDLAEYMAASDVAKRSILRRSKYRPIARLVQHQEAKAAVARWITGDRSNTASLTGEADRIRNKLASDQFEVDVNEHNAGYIEAFVGACGGLDLPACDMRLPGEHMAMNMNGVEVRFAPDLVLYRTNRRNVPKSGALFLMYSKGKAAREEEALHLSSISAGYLKGSTIENEHGEPERSLCLSVCVHTGTAYPAPETPLRASRTWRQRWQWWRASGTQ